MGDIILYKYHTIPLYIYVIVWSVTKSVTIIHKELNNFNLESFNCYYYIIKKILNI